MSTQLLIAIAALCTHPTQSRLRENEVLQCQKYYIQCYRKSEGPGMKEEALIISDCLTEKQSLGGSK